MIDTGLKLVFANQWLVVGIVSALLLGLAEFGYRLGIRLHAKSDEPRKSQIGGVQGAMLGMLGLLLGFTFAMAVNRYEARRNLVLQEANAIGTTYRRASFLPEVHKAAVEKLLRDYVEARLDLNSAGTNVKLRELAESKAAQIHSDLWAHATATGKETPTPLVNGFVVSLNETIDLAASRANALRAHVPGAVWLLVLVVASCGCCVSGYHAGASGARGAFTTIVLPFLVAIMITLIADLDRPYHGLINISQQPLIDLQRSMQAN